MEQLRRVGIIGGMGALACADLFYKVISCTNACCDNDHIPLLIDNNTQIPDRTAHILKGGISPLPMLIQSAKRLKDGGCDAIAISCNTAHYFADDILKVVDIELLHIAKIAVNTIVKEHKDTKKVAVIATDGTKKARIYDDILESYGYESVFIDEINQKNIMSCIYDGAKAGKIKEFTPLFKDVLMSVEADVYIAACTEIPLFLPYIDEKYKFIDATLELAKEIVRFSLNK